MITYIKGNIFASTCQTLVNPVNCEGVMGAGLALEFKLRHPEMFEKYAQLCKINSLTVGKLWLHSDIDYQILCFPTKTSWKADSRQSYIEEGLTKLVASLTAKNITSLALPYLGAGRGGLNMGQVKQLIEQYLGNLNIPIEVYEYCPNAHDAFYENLRQRIMSTETQQIQAETKIRMVTLDTIIGAMHSNKIRQCCQILQLPGVGARSVEKLVEWNSISNEDTQMGLF